MLTEIATPAQLDVVAIDEHCSTMAEAVNLVAEYPWAG